MLVVDEILIKDCFADTKQLIDDMWGEMQCYGSEIQKRKNTDAKYRKLQRIQGKKV